MAALQAVRLDEASIAELAGAFAGQLVRPADREFDATRAVWNGMIDRRPALVARCTGVADIRAALAFAREHALPVTVRGGGHSVAGKSVADDGVVIDLGPMRWAQVDPETRTVRVGPGAVGADLDRETQAFGLATTGGTDSTTGVVGLTLGGGMGFLGRQFGLAVDNLLGADVLLADGRLVHASETEQPDLFWALRGGGGNFGIVTNMELRLHPVGPDLAVAQVFLPYRDAPAALQLYREFTAEMASEIGCYLLAVNVPPVEPFPEEYHGTTAIAIVASYCGEVEIGLEQLRPLTGVGRPMLTVLESMPYTTLQQSFDAANPAGGRFFWKSEYLGALPDAALETFILQADPFPGPFSAAFFEALGGAMATRGRVALGGIGDLGPEDVLGVVGGLDRREPRPNRVIRFRSGLGRLRMVASSSKSSSGRSPLRIGIVIGLHGSPGQAPRWSDVRDQVVAAEEAGFDIAVVEDALLYRDDDGVLGYWEAVSIAGAICASTTQIEVGHSAINAPYRSAGLIAKIAETLDEIAGGRFILGIGLGNTLDYDQFGIRADRRYSRFAESIAIIHSLLKTGRADVDGRYQFARKSELVPRGPRPAGPPIVIAARGPKMMRLAAEYADGWNWWSTGPPDLSELRLILGELDRTCASVGRGSDTIRRSLDLYSLDPTGTTSGAAKTLSGDTEQIAAQLLVLGELGFDEVRCNLMSDGPDQRRRAIEAMTPVVNAVHNG